MNDGYSFLRNRWRRSDRTPTVLLSGLGLTLCFPPFPFSVLSGLVLLPLLHRWSRESNARNAWMEAYFVFQIPFLTIFIWPLFHLLPSAALPSLTPIILLPLLMSLPFGVACIVRRHTGLAAGLLTLFCAYLVQEWLLHLGPFAFPSTLLGSALSEATWFNQFADITGVAGLSAWIIACNICLHAARQSQQTRIKATLALLLCLLFILPVIYSYLRSNDKIIPKDSLDLLVVQPAISASEWAEPPDAYRIDVLIGLTDKGLATTEDKVDAIIWPESALPLPESFEAQESRALYLTEWLKKMQSQLFTGALRRLPSNDPKGASANSAQHFNEEGIMTTYDKNRLVPLAERVPFEDIWKGMQFFRVDAGGVPAFQPGTEQTLFSLNGYFLGPLICFESLFSNYTRGLVQNGAQGIVVFSQVDWWRTSLAARHYLAFSRLRSIENRRALLVSTVAGYSALIHPNGSISWQSNWHAEETISLALPLYETQTIYTRWGPVLYPCALIGLIGICIYTLINFLRPRLN